MSQRRAFTLAEALITCVLVGITFGVLMTLLRDFARIGRRSSQRDQALQGLVVGLDRIACELREAVSVDAPLTTTPETRLVFRKVDPSVLNRLPESPTPTTWDPHATAFLIQVAYQRDSQGRLTREVGPVAGVPLARQSLTEELAGLQFTSPSGRTCRIEMSVLEGRKVQSLQMEVLCPCLP